MQKNKVLMICYYFPPLLDVGCKRSVAFSKYLKSHGWEPHVISVLNPDKHYCLLGDDSPPSGVPVTYVRSLFSLSWIMGKLNGVFVRLIAPLRIKLKRNYLIDLICIPDLFIGWIPGAIFGGYRIIKKHNIDYIYVSCSPFSSALSGIVLKKMTGKPLVIDFRDPLAVNVPSILGIPSFRRKINLKIEQIIIYFANIFIVNTEEVRKGFIDVYPEIANKTLTIHNGFDRELMPSDTPEKFSKFTVVYGGNMYFEGDDSSPYFEAIVRLKEANKIDSNVFQFLYFGHDYRSVDTIADKYGIKDLVHVHSPISHTEMLKVLMRSHFQLLRIIKPCISTKLFEGIALNLPFLATIPQGEVADIIREYSPSSYVVSETSRHEIEAALMAMLAAHRTGNVENNLVTLFLEKFSREQMTSKLEGALENIYAQGTAVP